MAIAEFDDTAAAELGPLLRDTARVVETLCQPEQTYVCMWSHGRYARKHLHIAVQQVTAAVRARYGGLRSERLQAQMLADGDEPDITEVEQFCERAREFVPSDRRQRCRRPQLITGTAPTPRRCWAPYATKRCSRLHHPPPT